MDFLIVANWKMNGSREIAINYKQTLEKFLAKNIKDNLIICPPAPYLDILKSDFYKTGAQDLSAYQFFGSHTGEINAKMLKDLGSSYVIIGHSERRSIEPPEILRAKISAAQAEGLKVIYCIGETRVQRENGSYITSILKQIDEVFDSPNKQTNAANSPCIIAYEPIWAIGSGKVISKEDLQEVSTAIFQHLTKHYQFDSNDVKLLYGGSVSAENVKNFINIKQINGLLIGTTSLNCLDIIKILEMVC